MPTRKIGDAPPVPCRDPDHDPATHIVREPGTYEHECPSCKRKMVFTVPRVTMQAHGLNPIKDQPGLYRDPVTGGIHIIRERLTF